MLVSVSRILASSDWVLPIRLSSAVNFWAGIRRASTVGEKMWPEIFSISELTFSSSSASRSTIESSRPQTAVIESTTSPGSRRTVSVKDLIDFGVT